MKKNFLFLLIILLSFFLRFYKLGQNPPSLYWDEVSLGYNAYSILKTGHDEHNRFLPYDTFAAFGDYKPIGYVYAAVPSIWFFGLNEFAVRLPSALAGVGMVIVTYFLVKELFHQSHKSYRENFLPLISSLLLAISPWSLQMSRAAFEANLAAFFNLTAIWLFMKAINNKKYQWLICLSAVFFVVSAYTFNANRILASIFFGFLWLVIFLKKKISIKYLILSFFLALILALPLVPHLLSPEGKLRFNEVNIFTDSQPVLDSNDRINFDNNAWWARIIHNRRISYGLLFFSHYFDNFKSDFLFIKGDFNPRLSIQDIGQLYLIELPLLILGFYYLFVNKEKWGWFLIFWLLIVPIPAGMARETPHALRTISILPTYQIIIAYGIVNFLRKFKSFAHLPASTRRWQPGLFICLFVYLLIFIVYLHNYYFHYPQHWSGEWQYGYKQMIEEVVKKEDNYEKVIITPYLGRPYIYFLFYKKYNPRQFFQYQDLTYKDRWGAYAVTGFDKYEFREYDDNKDNHKNRLFVLPRNHSMERFRLIKKIYDLAGEEVFILAEKI